MHTFMYSGFLYLIQGTLDWSPLLLVDMEHWLASQGGTCSCHWAKSASLTLTFSVEIANSPVFFASPPPVEEKCIPLLFPSHINSQTPRAKLARFIHQLTAVDKANLLFARAAHEG